MKRKRHMLVQRNIAAQKRKVNYGEVEVIPFIVKASNEFSIVNAEISVQVRGRGCSLCCFVYFKLTYIDAF